MDDARTTAAGDAAAMGSALADARAEAHRLSVELAGEGYNTHVGCIRQTSKGEANG